MFGNISPQDTPDCSLVEREPEEKYLPRTPYAHTLLRVPVTGRHPAVAKLVWVIFGRSGRVTSPHSDYRSQFVFFTFQISSTLPLSPPPAVGGLSSLLLGGYVPMQNPGACANRQSLLQGPRFGLVGVDFGWEGSPTTFGSLIHFVFSSRKKGQPLCLCLL